MARSRTPEAARASSEVADSEIQADDTSSDELVSVSNKSPAMPSSVEPTIPPTGSLPGFWIALPPLPKDYDDYKRIYPPPLPKPTEARDSDGDHSDGDVPIRLVGATRENGKHHYYAEVKGGVVHRFARALIRAKFPKLVKDYNRRVNAGELSDFKPSDVKVHPRHRPLTIRLKPDQLAKARKSKARSASVRSSNVTGPSSDDGDDAVSTSSNDADSDDAASIRKSARIADQPKRPSPRPRHNLRSRGKADSGSSSDDNADSGSAYSVDDDGDASDTSKNKLPKITLKRARPMRDTIQGLGVIRSMSDGEESESGAEGVYLRRHRNTCDRCQERPAHKQLAAYQKRKSKGKPGRKRKKANEDEESEDEEERLERLGGWIRCLHCCMSKHWGCLTGQEKLDVQLAVRKHETDVQNAEKRARGWDVPEDAPMVGKRKAIWLDQTTEYVCDMCTRTAPCIVCRQDTSPKGAPLAPVAPPVPIPPLAGGSGAEDVIDLTTPPPETSIAIHPATPAPTANNASPSSKSSAKPLTMRKPDEVHTTYANPKWPQVLFRCLRCRRPAHWQHVLPRDPKDDEQRTAMQIAEVVQSDPDAWKCHDCVRWVHPAESILAWRPDSSGITENFGPGIVPNVSDPLRREYLVKFKERGFRRVEWVPHMWLVSMHKGLLRNFLKSGTKLPLLEDNSEEFQEKIGKYQSKDKGKGRALDIPPGFARSRSASTERDKGGEREYEGTPGPMLDAELRIPDSWLRIDRLLDVRLRLPVASSNKKPIKAKGKGKGKQKRVADSEEELVSDSEGSTDGPDDKFIDGKEPDEDLTESAADFERRRGRMPTGAEIKERAVWVFTKFEGLQYDECVWDSPPKPGSLEWDSYTRAISRYVFAQSVEVTKLTRAEEAQRDGRARKELTHWSKFDLQTKLKDKSLSLMPFQVQGLQWLYGNWWNLQPSILADDMGLGKTIQLVSLIGKLVKENVYPHLIVVPNSTIVNWIREFERWTPHVRVVQFNGDAKARQVIKDYELWNGDKKQMYHAIVTTYETLHGAEFTPVFKKPGRWEVLVVDEGQRLKSDSSLLFRKLAELNTVHRILMTGTPLNNNIRELFNLMNFLDPDGWNNLDDLEKEYDQENLTEELLGHLHERLRPYFLRRQKAEVLDLPDKHEVIIPVSLAPIQKDIMRAILEANLSTLGLFADKNSRETRKGPGPKKSTLNNALMEMRKCIQHPYLNERDIERRGLSHEETLKQLVDASAKFRLLQKLLPQLKQRGHRVLLFSQFKIVLDIIEDFLNMEGYKLLRLDGDTKSSLRQKEIDDFNKPGSDYFIYILTTRAVFSTPVRLPECLPRVVVLIVSDQISTPIKIYKRLHERTVFKFMGKDTPEEKIFMMGKKKLVLDHLIVQKLGDEDEVDDIQGLLTFGAKALFENPGESTSDIKYTDYDIEQLVTRAETEKVEEKRSTESGMKFDFAQVWDRAKGTTTHIPEDDQGAGADDDFWAGVIKRAAEEKAQKRAQELTGRGARKRAVTNYNEADFLDGSPEKKPKGQKIKSAPTSKSGSASDRDFEPPGNESSSSHDDQDGAPGPDDHTLGPSGFSGVYGVQTPGISVSAQPGLVAAQRNIVPSPPRPPPVTLPGQPFDPLVIKPPKPKKPRKPRAKPPVAPAADFLSQPSTSTGPFTGLSGANDPFYECQLCNRLHRLGQCPMNSDQTIDRLLQTRAQIMRQDNEDEETHKFWALNHIDKKLAEVHLDITKLPNPRFNADSSPKAKAPRAPFAGLGTASTSGLKIVSSQTNGSGSSKAPSAAKASGLRIVSGDPKPRKKKPVVLPPDHSVFTPPTVADPYLPLAPPVARRPVVRPPTLPQSSGLALQPTSRAPAVVNVPNGMYAAPSGLGLQNVANAQARSAIIAAAASRPKIQPPPRAPSFSPPPVGQLMSSAATSMPSTSTKKRQATGQPEEPRKKRNTKCLICGQQPGHPAHECPEVESTEGIRRAIQKLEASGESEVGLRLK
ncbi:hypothetical protein FRC10_010488 [Ceratobasidium sp. 414]|nr:hypothetical protein FRC10_010488 [Ceratobasidium sp. 414]